MTRPETFPALLREHATRRPSEKALRWKKHGIWKPYTWRDYYEHVKLAAMGLRALGVERGDRVGYVTDNRPAWLFFEVGAQCLGASPVGAYYESLAEEIAYILGKAKAKVVFVDSQEQADKVLEAREIDATSVEAIIVDDTRGMWRYWEKYRGLIYSYKQLEEMGAKLLKEEPGFVEESIDKLSGEDTAGIFPTSGTTGKPKLAMLSFKGMLSMAEQLLEVDPVGPEDEYVSFLPPAWVGEQMMCLSLHMLARFKVNFPETRETLWEDFREIGPTFMFAPEDMGEHCFERAG